MPGGLVSMDSGWHHPSLLGRVQPERPFSHTAERCGQYRLHQNQTAHCVATEAYAISRNWLVFFKIQQSQMAVNVWWVAPSVHNVWWVAPSVQSCHIKTYPKSLSALGGTIRPRACRFVENRKPSLTPAKRFLPAKRFPRGRPRKAPS